VPGLGLAAATAEVEVVVCIDMYSQLTACASIVDIVSVIVACRYHPCNIKSLTFFVCMPACLSAILQA
jgi:hypothetical protein